MSLEQNAILYERIRGLRFPEFDGYMTQSEMKAFSFWVTPTSRGFQTTIKAMSSQFAPLIAHLSHCLDSIEYASSGEVEQKYLFPSIEAYLVCVLFHYVPPQYYEGLEIDENAVNKINVALLLWQSGLIPIFDGLTWRLHNTDAVVSSGMKPPEDLSQGGED